MLPKFEKNIQSGLVDAQITPEEFDFIRTVVEKNAGIVLGTNKLQLVQGRLVRRARELGLNSIGEYCDVIRNGGPEELVGLINAITTNVTSFFRESHHFDALTAVMLPEAMGRNERTRRMRIWSAGCSSGEEPYSIAMASAEVLASSRGWDFKILATDIDSEMLHVAEHGCYSGDRLTGVSEERRRRWFVRSDSHHELEWQVVPELRTLITFRPLNLMNNWPMRGPFDVIFCRNVMIYFDQPTRDRLLMRYAGLLANGGYLCLGHSESIHSQHSHFKLVGRTIYRKIGG
ncbi:MAG TPA: protein-glutamate O-methyltransferase CheR [Steroidobacteraceae bacterium]|nr:protein-glutamate O-methyltransferase CheR [Steroidobacteraceae bacterium]